MHHCQTSLGTCAGWQAALGPVSTTGVLLGPDAHSCQSEAECLRACIQHGPRNGCTGSDSPPAADSRLLRSGISRDSAQLCTSAIVIDDGLVCLEPAHLAEVGHRHDPLCTTGQAAAAVPARTPQPQCTHNGAELNGLAAVSGDNPSSTDCPTDVNQATCNVTSSAPGAPSAVVAPLSLAQPRSSYAYAVKFGAAGPHFGDVAHPRSSAAVDTALDHPLGPVEYPHPQPVQDADDEAYAICAGNGSVPTEGAVAHSDPAPYRQNAQFDTYGNWPFPVARFPHSLASTYNMVRAAGRPNAKGARVPLPSTLVLPVWQRERTGHEDDDMVIDGVAFGFPIQYTGGPQYGRDVPYNHPSAQAFNSNVDEYIQTELAHGALEGPFIAPPFTPWTIGSPLMTREKTEPGKHRIIVDLSYPEGGVNAYIDPHTYDSREARHCLPTVERAVQVISKMCGSDVYMAVIDLSRAYRHFRVCPLDWPLLAIQHKRAFYFDRAVPFGARMSSYIMQSIADFIVRALERRGITALIYLDDLIIIGRGPESVHAQFHEACTVITDLGLRIAAHKVQSPAPAVTWLGIRIDTVANEISIPHLSWILSRGVWLQRGRRNH